MLSVYAFCITGLLSGTVVGGRVIIILIKVDHDCPAFAIVQGIAGHGVGFRDGSLWRHRRGWGGFGLGNDQEKDVGRVEGRWKRIVWSKVGEYR